MMKKKVGILALILSLPLCAIQSDRIEQLRAELVENSEAEQLFWEEVTQQGSPLIEPGESEEAIRATLLWKGDTDTSGVMVMRGPAGSDDLPDTMERVEGTDVWYRTYELPKDFQAVYWFGVNKAPISCGKLSSEEWTNAFKQQLVDRNDDPLNPKVFNYPNSSASLLEISIAYKHGYDHVKPINPIGTVQQYEVDSSGLGNQRLVWVYTPPGYTQAENRYPLLIIFDGGAYLELIPTPTILDNMIAQGVLPPVVALFVGNATQTSRNVELPCNRVFTSFVMDELVPWVEKKYHTGGDRTLRTVVGSSYGGLAAGYMGITRSKEIGNILSQSGAFGWRRDESQPVECLLHYLEQYDLSDTPLRVYLDVGMCEGDDCMGWTNHVDSNRHLRDLLVDQGHEVFHHEFHGNHDYVNWNQTLAEGLIELHGNVQ